MVRHRDISDSSVITAIRRQKISFAGHSDLKIYGTLRCKSGKRMNRANRVFFTSVAEAGQFGFRPCGNCMRQEYLVWKNNNNP